MIVLKLACFFICAMMAYGVYKHKAQMHWSWSDSLIFGSIFGLLVAVWILLLLSTVFSVGYLIFFM